MTQTATDRLEQLIADVRQVRASTRDPRARRRPLRNTMRKNFSVIVGTDVTVV